MILDDLVSIIVPVYNGELTLRETIDSVRSQTYQNWELILINDGSTDNSADVINQYTDQRIKFLTQINKGVSFARNLGISEAKGKYIAFLDADDLWAPDKLTKSIVTMEDSESVLVYSDVNLFYNNVNESVFFKYREPINEINNYLKLLIYDYIPTLTVVVKKDVLKAIGVFDTTLHGTEDWDLWLRIAKSHKITYIPEALSYYRYSENGLSKNRDKHLIEEEKVLKKHLHDNLDIPKQIKRKAYWVFSKKNFFNNMIKKRYFRAFLNYLQMIYLMPLNLYNLQLFWKRNG